jgi:hypothetical protein
MHQEADRKQQREIGIVTAGWCDSHKSHTDFLHDEGSRSYHSGSAKQDCDIGHTESSETNYYAHAQQAPVLLAMTPHYHNQ